MYFYLNKILITRPLLVIEYLIVVSQLGCGYLFHHCTLLSVISHYESCITFLYTSTILLQTDDTPNLLAKEELNLLARLMGSMKADDMPKTETGFQINLFTTDQEEEEEAWVLFFFFTHSLLFNWHYFTPI